MGLRNYMSATKLLYFNSSRIYPLRDISLLPYHQHFDLHYDDLQWTTLHYLHWLFNLLLLLLFKQLVFVLFSSKLW